MEAGALCPCLWGYGAPDSVGLCYSVTWFCSCASWKQAPYVPACGVMELQTVWDCVTQSPGSVPGPPAQTAPTGWPSSSARTPTSASGSTSPGSTSVTRKTAVRERVSACCREPGCRSLLFLLLSTVGRPLWLADSVCLRPGTDCIRTLFNWPGNLTTSSR
ncbi:unnamed protein product [Oncorhynchus mykiss]|uniref:Uncharacterized protein n=1 Tax=Oncorhynchus mykiss TaxID=8022 RepID=A0A060YEE5_ONCMY|nr:unnamed protein product [Oncorhynchus mykiss]